MIQRTRVYAQEIAVEEMSICKELSRRREEGRREGKRAARIRNTRGNVEPGLERRAASDICMFE